MSLVPPPKKSLGQHFLFDPSILERIVAASGLTGGEAALEIGPGPGGLTKAILATGARVVAVEADGRMVELLNEARPPNLTVVHGDAMKVDFAELVKEFSPPVRLIGNLPYNISGPLIAKLLKSRSVFSSMTVMLQKEVADRIAAPPGTKARGTLTVLAELFCDVSQVMKLPPGAFRPPPKVDSAVIHLEVLAEPRHPLADEAALWRLVKVLFQKRRKMIRGGLKAMSAEYPEWLEAAGLLGTERPEQLTSSEWAALSNAVCRTI